MNAVLRRDSLAVEIPETLSTLSDFRRWALALEFPENGRIAYLNGLLHVDVSMEQAFSHNLVKGCFASVLSGIVATDQSGYLFSDGMLYSNESANLSTIPETIFVSFESIEAERIRCIEGESRGCVELEGSADMTLEVISDSSEEKDNVTLRSLYWKAQVKEYWIVDVRDDNLRFDILRFGPRGYQQSRRLPGNWLRSDVFRRSFRLRRNADRLGNPSFTLEFRE